MADAHTKHHDYHLVDPSPWPFLGSVGALVMAHMGEVNDEDMTRLFTAMDDYLASIDQ